MAEKQKTKSRSLPAAELFALALIFAQVILVALIIREVGLETLAFRRIVFIAVGGFVVHHLLPLRLRLPFFTILSIACMFLILGGNPESRLPNLALAVPRAGMLVAVGAILIAICNLPIGFWKRAGLLFVAAAVLAAFRAGVWESGNLAIVWPVLAAMFMFRIIVYLYDISIEKQRPPTSRSLAYFFLIPNVCTLLFPVIDFRTFCQKYYDEEALLIYRRGARWMARGVVHLLLYRLVDRFLSIPVSDVGNGTDLIRFIISNSFLYLKVSGIFHLSIGMLLLFGFNLPETNHRYFLASSFTDYWRRINIYWRNFIMKVFYYPTFFRCKSLGPVVALILATLASFFVTWALHFYQTWWVKGTVSVTGPDALFWTVLALLVLANSLWEYKRGRKRTLAPGGYSARQALGLALRTAGTFAVISTLWSLWSTPNIRQWLFIWSLADLHTLLWGGVILVAIGVATLLFEVLPNLKNRPPDLVPDAILGPLPWFRQECLRGFAPIAIMFGLVHSVSHGLLPIPGNEALRSALLNIDLPMVATLPKQERGYYENLSALDNANKQLGETFQRQAFPFNPIGRVNDYCWYEVLPNVSGKYVGVPFVSNRWGMRDHDYELKKPPGTLRLALLGSSNVMGYGVSAADMFESIIETRLNDDYSKDVCFEILNFAVSGVGPLGQISILDKRVRQFHPDIVLFVAHRVDFEWVNRDAYGGLRENLLIKYKFLDNVLREASVNEGTTEKIATERLRPFESELLLGSYTEIAQRCRSMNALPVCVFLPLVRDLSQQDAQPNNLLELAKKAGFITIDLSDIYVDQEPMKLAQSDIWKHMNAKFNAIVAAVLYDRFTTDPRIGLPDRARRVAATTLERSTTALQSNHDRLLNNRTVR